MFDLQRFRIQAIYRFILWAKKSKSIRADYDFSENKQSEGRSVKWTKWVIQPLSQTADPKSLLSTALPRCTDLLGYLCQVFI